MSMKEVDWYEDLEYLSYKKELEKISPGITNTDAFYNLTGRIEEVITNTLLNQN